MQTSPAPRDLLERASRAITLTVGMLAIVSAIAAPLLALSWSQEPFPGFMIEAGLQVVDTDGHGWAGMAAGLGFGQRVLRIAGMPIDSSAEYHMMLSSLSVGQAIPVFAVSRDGSAHLYRDITLIEFPDRDMVRLFWLPYLIGMVYLGIGIWIYLVRGQTRPGRVLAFFCFCMAVTFCLFFDLSTSHMGSVAWTAAVAQLGSAVVSLALRFPQEWRIVERRPWVLVAPYALSALLAGWGVQSLFDAGNPWAFVPARDAIYRFVALATLAFLGTMAYRAFSSPSALVQRQARLVLTGGLIAFLPLVVWFLTPLVGVSLRFDTSYYLPPLVVFPAFVAVAILRFRLLEVDALVNRTLFYGVLTAILTGVFAGLTALLQRLFVAITGERSDAAIILTTLIVVAAFEPLKARVRGLVDRRLKEERDDTRELRAFGHDVHCFLEMSDPHEITRRLLDETVRALHAASGAISLYADRRLQQVHSCGPWCGEAYLCVPLDSNGERFGFLYLGLQLASRPYSRRELLEVQEAANHVAAAIRLATVYRRQAASATGTGVAQEARAEVSPTWSVMPGGAGRHG
jgi:hypothetical protein